MSEKKEKSLLKVTVNGTELKATLADNKTAQEFIHILPLTLMMDDGLDREKYVDISQSLTVDENCITKTYELGVIYYWLGGGIAEFYNQDGAEIKHGLVALATLDSGTELFKGTTTIKVTIELA